MSRVEKEKSIFQKIQNWFIFSTFYVQLQKAAINSKSVSGLRSRKRRSEEEKRRKRAFQSWKNGRQTSQTQQKATWRSERENEM